MSALPPSLYAETARPPVATPPLTGKRRCAVAIVGGGYTGLSAALHLAERGTDVAVLEAHEPGWGASGRNGGQVNPGLKHDPDVVERDFGAERGGRMVAFAGAAPDRVFALIERHGIDCEARRAGTLRAAIGARYAEAVRASAAQATSRRLPVELLEADAARAATGTDRYACALLDRRGGSLNPLGYARGLAAAAIRAGAAVHGDSPAQRLWRDGARWIVDTQAGRLCADTVVLATNGYTDDLWPGLRRTIVPVHSAIAATAPLPGPLARAILPAGPVLYEVGALTVYYRLDAAGRLLIGGRSASRDLTDPRAFGYLHRYALRLFPALRDAVWTHGWNGRVAFTSDQYPHLHELAPGVIAGLGYSGRGIAMATAMGELLARRILGASAQDIELPISPPHAIRWHALWRLGVAARLLEGRIRERLGR